MNNGMVGLTGYPTVGSGSVAAGTYLSAICSTSSSLTVTISIASPAVIARTAHGIPATTAVNLSSSGALPTGLAAGTIYYVTAGSSLLADSLQLSTSVSAALAGMPITTTGSQSGTQTLTPTTPNLTTNTPVDLCGFMLQPGNWDVSGTVNFLAAPSTVMNAAWAAINTTSATIQSAPDGFQQWAGTTPAGFSMIHSSGAPRRISALVPTNVFLVAEAIFTTSSLTAFGGIRALSV